MAAQCLPTMTPTRVRLPSSVSTHAMAAQLRCHPAIPHWERIARRTSAGSGTTTSPVERSQQGSRSARYAARTIKRVSGALPGYSQASLVLLMASLRDHLGARASTLLPALDEAHWLVLDERDDTFAGGDGLAVPAPDALAFLQYTSGSTRTPQGRDDQPRQPRSQRADDGAGVRSHRTLGGGVVATTVSRYGADRQCAATALPGVPHGADVAHCLHPEAGALVARDRAVRQRPGVVRRAQLCV